jgi:ABC-type transport system substrate-binding protein
MKRQVNMIMAAAIAASVALVAVATAGPASAQEDGDVTMTIGLTQDLSSPNVSVGYLVADYEVWNLQYATLTDKAAEDFSTIPALAESWEGRRTG